MLDHSFAELKYWLCCHHVLVWNLSLAVVCRFCDALHLNEFEDTVSSVKADILKLRQENNSLKSKILLLENSISKETSSVCENNNLAPVTATNIPDKTINTIVKCH